MASRDARDGLRRPRAGARIRILDTAYELFSRQGVRAVGIDRIIANADIAKATLYRHFASKEDLVLAFLDLRAERWTHGWLEGETERLAKRPEHRMLAVFDALDGWFRRADFEGCSFINTLLEITDAHSPIRRKAATQLGVIRGILERYAQDAAAPDPAEMGFQQQILMMGAIVSAGGGDVDAARRARELSELLLESSQARPALQAYSTGDPGTG